MNKVAFLAATAIAFTTSAIASESMKVKAMDDVTYVIPPNSPVGKATVKEYDVVEYAGRIMVSGKYEYGYATNDPTDEDNYGSKFLTFTLDESSILKLPYWSRDGQVADDLEINNPEDFARALISEEQQADLEARKIMSISGTAIILIDRFQTHVECDHQYDTADFLSFVDKNYTASRALAEGYGC